MGKLPKCSVLHTREVSIPNCKDALEHCTRTYRLSLPDILCDASVVERRVQQGVRRGEAAVDEGDEKFFEGEYRKVGTLPMVFAFHGLGMDYQPMAGYAETANQHNFVLIFPSGINNSFNAGDCCGDAQKLSIHDVDFIAHLQTVLSDEFEFVRPQLSYGIGYDNGGLLLTDAAIESPHLFKAIVPIAGYSTRRGIPPSVGTGIGLMMHHSLDDLIMRPSGCCDDPEMPVCQGDLVKKSCDSVLESFDLWARKVNLCEKDEGSTNSPLNTILEGGDGGSFYTVEQEDGVTSIAFATIPSEHGLEPKRGLSVSEIPLSVTYTHNGVVCLTTPSSGCVANSTLCLYKEMGHFDGYVSTPYMGNQIMDFLARDACSTHGGSWESTGSYDSNICKCSVGLNSGVFCLDEPEGDVVIGVQDSVPTEESIVTASSPSLIVDPEEPLMNEEPSPVTQSLSHVVNEQVSLPVLYGLVGIVLAVSVTIVFLMRKTRAEKGGADSPLQRKINSYDMSVSLPSMSFSRFSPYHDQIIKGKSASDSFVRVKTNFGGESSPPRKSRSWFGFGKKKEEPLPLQRKLSEGHVSDDDRSVGSCVSTGSVGSLKSLDAIDLQLLQFYRKKSEGTEGAQIQRKKSMDSVGSSGLNPDDQGVADQMGLDLELLQSYRRRKEEKERRSLQMQREENARHHRNNSLTGSLHSNDSSDALNAYLFTDLFKEDQTSDLEDEDNEQNKDKQGDEKSVISIHSTEYIKNLLWDGSFNDGSESPTDL